MSETQASVSKSVVQVLFAPLTKVALVTKEGVKTPPCWAVSQEWGCREEWAPQMFNTHHDPSRSFVEMEDEHPFPKVLAELKRLIELDWSSEDDDD